MSLVADARHAQACEAPEPLAPAQAPASARPPVRRWLSDASLEWAECLGVLAFYTWLVARIVTAAAHGAGAANLVLLPSEGLVLVFMLIRRRSHTLARAPSAWLLAIAATCLPLLVVPSTAPSTLPQSVGATLMLMGIFIQLSAKVALGRSFGCVAANRGIKLGGPYRFVRHPMYAGYLLSHVAFLALNPTLWNALVYTIAYPVQLPRLLAEERLLSADPAYRAYRVSVPYRLVPGLF